MAKIGLNQDFSFYHRNLTTLSFLFQTRDKKIRKMKFEIKIKFHKLLGTENL